MLKFLFSVAAVAYPFAVYLLVGDVANVWLIGLLALLIFTRTAMALRHRPIALALVAAALLAGGAYLARQPSLTLLKLYPVAIHISLVSICIYTLIHPPSAIERIARRMGMVMPAHGPSYTRTLTMIWCAFFVANAVAAGYTALAASTAVWAWYNGFLSYLIAGALLAGEYLYRVTVVQPRYRRQSEQ